MEIHSSGFAFLASIPRCKFQSKLDNRYGNGKDGHFDYVCGLFCNQKKFFLFNLYLNQKNPKIVKLFTTALISNKKNHINNLNRLLFKTLF